MTTQQVIVYCVAALFVSAYSIYVLRDRWKGRAARRAADAERGLRASPVRAQRDTRFWILVAILIAIAIGMTVMKTRGTPGMRGAVSALETAMDWFMYVAAGLVVVLVVLLVVLWWLTRDPVLKEVAQLALEKRYDDAIARLQPHVRDKGENAQRLNVLGLLFMESGRLDEALEQFRKAEAFKDHRNDSLNNQALVLHKMGRADEALALMKQLSDAAPGDAVIACNYCTFLADAGREAEARDALERAERIIDRYDERQLPETWKAAIGECRARLPRARGFPVEGPAPAPVER